MRANRLEALTDGVVAIAITVMVLELKVPQGTTLAALRGDLPILAVYALSFVNIGLYWANHHHMFQATEHIDGRVLWANLFLLFWLSLVPWVIRWLDEASFAAAPTAAYGVVLGMAGVAYNLTQAAVIACNGGAESKIARAVGADWKGKLSVAGYIAAVPLAFVSPAISLVLYVAIAAVWLVPDRRIERKLVGH